MPRKLKTYQTSQGFYDLAIAAPSMKAALKAWGVSSNLFHQGFAKESEDSKVIAAAMAKPGIVMRRPVGSDTAFSEHSELPSAASLDAPQRPSKAKPEKAKPAKEQKVDEKAERRAAAAYEKEQQRRERQRQKEEASTPSAMNAAVRRLLEMAGDNLRGRVQLAFNPKSRAFALGDIRSLRRPRLSSSGCPQRRP